MFSSFKSEMTLKSSQPKTNTLPNAKSESKAEKAFKLSKSSTLPSGGFGSMPRKGRPEISRPILQTATPCAASLIMKAPSTGVPQGSILASNHKHDRPARDKPVRGVVFCDPLTMPSPTNPNTPPIIHQPHHALTTTTASTTTTTPSISAATVTETVVDSPCSITSTFITPTWSVVTLPKPDAVVCRFDDYSDTEDSLISPDVNEKLIHGFSKFRSKLRKKAKDLSPPSTSERRRFRSLDISGPILQSSSDSRMNLIPVCRAADVEPYPENNYVNVEFTSIKENQTNKMRENCVFKTRTSPTKISRRPASIAAVRPSRPKARPPQPPPSKSGYYAAGKEPIYSTISDVIDSSPPLLPVRPSSLVGTLGISSVEGSEVSTDSPQEFSTPTSPTVFSSKSLESSCKFPEANLKSLEPSCKSPESTCKSSVLFPIFSLSNSKFSKEISKSPEVNTKSPEAISKCSEEIPKSSQEIPKSPEALLKSPEAILESPKIISKSSEADPKSPESTPKYPKSTPKSTDFHFKSPEIDTKSPQVQLVCKSPILDLSFKSTDKELTSKSPDAQSPGSSLEGDFLQEIIKEIKISNEGDSIGLSPILKKDKKKNVF